MLQNIDQRQLSIPEFVSYRIMKKSCQPMASLMIKIEEESEDFADQAKILTTLKHLCSDGVLGLSALYVNQETSE
jgi:hypothetical protein